MRRTLHPGGESDTCLFFLSFATLFCCGCNLGPVQTTRSVKDISRKQIAWLNLHHITEARLEQATETVPARQKNGKKTTN